MNLLQFKKKLLASIAKASMSEVQVELVLQEIAQASVYYDREAYRAIELSGNEGHLRHFISNQLYKLAPKEQEQQDFFQQNLNAYKDSWFMDMASFEQGLLLAKSAHRQDWQGFIAQNQTLYKHLEYYTRAFLLHAQPLFTSWLHQEAQLPDLATIIAIRQLMEENKPSTSIINGAFLIAAPTAKDQGLPLNWRAEVQRVKESIQLPLLFTHRDQAQYKDLERCLTKESPSILHFIGHGIREQGGLTQLLNDSHGIANGALLFHATLTNSIPDPKNEEVIGAGVLGNTFKAMRALGKAPTLLVINSCHSLMVAPEIAPYVRYVIATDDELHDTAGIVFSAYFYQELAQYAELTDESITESFLYAQSQIAGNSSKNRANYCLFLNETTL